MGTHMEFAEEFIGFIDIHSSFLFIDIVAGNFDKQLRLFEQFYCCKLIRPFLGVLVVLGVWSLGIWQKAYVLIFQRFLSQNWHFRVDFE